MSRVARQNIAFVPVAAIENVFDGLVRRPLVVLNTLINALRPAGKYPVAIVGSGFACRGAAADECQCDQEPTEGGFCELHELCLIGTRDGTFMFILSAHLVFSESGVRWRHKKMRLHSQIAEGRVSLFALVPFCPGLYRCRDGRLASIHN